MNISATLTRIEAVLCTTCNGHGVTHGVFHRFPCEDCYETGYVQLANQQPLDTIAVSIVANAKQAAAAAQSRARLNGRDRGTPDNWVLKNNFRGD